MPRRAKIQRREMLPDPKYNSVLVTRVVNSLMRRGKKSVSEHILYGALEQIEKTTKQDGLSVLKQAVSNAKPQLEVKSRRVGGATYQVPIEVKPERRMALALRWLIGFAKARPGNSMREKFAAEVLAAAKNEGGAIKKKDDTHRMAEANKAFSHYRF